MIMVDELLGDIVIDGNCVLYSDRVGRYVTPEQKAVLLRTAEALGKIAIDDRYPADPMEADNVEFFHGASELSRLLGRNEHGLPKNEFHRSIVRQADRLYGRGDK